MAVARKNTKKATKTASDMRSFKVYPGEPFFKPRISHQTFYWLVIAMLVLALGVWIIYLTMKVQAIYDRVDMITISGNR